MLLLLGVCGSAAAATASPLPQPPLTRGHTVPVRVGLYITQLIDVDEVREAWQLAGELRMQWTDPRLRFRGPPGTLRYYQPNEVWTPRVHISNAFTPRTSATADVYVDQAGRVSYSELMWATVATPLDVHRFPFDTERLPAIFEPLGMDASVVRLIADKRLSGINSADFTHLSQWQIRNLDVGTITIEGTVFRPAHAAVDFGLVVSRNPQSFVWKFMVPLFAIVVLSWLAFWMPSDEYGIKEQLGIAVTTLLTTVAFTLALTNFLPRVAYFTFIDGYVLFCFLWVLGGMAIIYVEAYLKTHRRQAGAERLRHAAAFALPISFIIAQALLFIAMRPA